MLSEMHMSTNDKTHHGEYTVHDRYIWTKEAVCMWAYMTGHRHVTVT